MDCWGLLIFQDLQSILETQEYQTRTCKVLEATSRISKGKVKSWNSEFDGIGIGDSIPLLFLLQFFCFLLLQAHLTPELQHDFKCVVELASRLLQELMKATVLDPADYTGLEAALDNHKVSLYFTESPTNPFLRCVDIELVSKMCHEKGAIVCIDGTFATPLNQKALALGADIMAVIPHMAQGQASDPYKLPLPFENINNVVKLFYAFRSNGFLTPQGHKYIVDDRMAPMNPAWVAH
ncbi:hypothetical protein LXL04_034843 [Taraxacum kok-saghyz]